MDKNDLIYRNDLLAAYDAAHKGPPGGARKLMEEAPAVDAIPVDFLTQYEREPLLKDAVYKIKYIWYKAKEEKNTTHL